MIKQIMPLSLIVALRFFGLFIVLPVLSIYALEMEGATPFLAGLVVGGYALTQAATRCRSYRFCGLCNDR